MNQYIRYWITLKIPQNIALFTYFAKLKGFIKEATTAFHMDQALGPVKFLTPIPTLH